MVRGSALSACLVIFLALPLAAEEWAQKMFETDSHDFGQVARNAKAEYPFVLANPYLEDVHVASAVPSCSCTSLRIETPWLKTYEKGAIVAVFNTKAFRGQHGATVTVTFDRPFYATAQFHVKGYVRDDVTFSPENVELGTVDQGCPAEKWVTVTFSSSSGWQIREVRSSNPHLSAEVAQRGMDANSVSYGMRVRLDAKAPVGYLRDHLMLVTNDGQATQFPVLVEGRVVSAVTVSPASLFLGVLRPGESVSKRLVVQGKKPFCVTSVTSEGKSFKLTWTKDDQAKPVHLIPVTFEANNQAGQAVQVVRIQTDLDGKVAELPAYVVVKALETAKGEAAPGQK